MDPTPDLSDSRRRPLRRHLNPLTWAILAGLLVLGLWGDASPSKLRGWTAVVGRSITNAEPYRVRDEALRNEIQRLEDRAAVHARVAAALDVRIGELDEQLRTLTQAQADDEALMAALEPWLSRAEADGTVQIDGGRFTGAELEQEAEILLARHAARDARSAEHQARRKHLQERRHEVRLALRENRETVDRLADRQGRILDQIEYREADELLEAADRSPAVKQAAAIEREQRDLQRAIDVEVRSRQVVREWSRTATPAAESLMQSVEPAAVRLRKVLEQSEVAQIPGAQR